MSLPFNARGVNIDVNDDGAVRVYEPSTGPQQTYFSRHLRNAGGSSDIDGNYSGAPEKFFIAPGPGEIYRVARMLVFIEDSKINADDYGAIAGGLTVGMKLAVEDSVGTVLNDLLDAGTVNSNAEWGEYCFDAEARAWGVGNEFLTVRWTFTKGGVFIRLVGDDDERLVITASDDLTGLVAHEYIVQGYIE